MSTKRISDKLPVGLARAPLNPDFLCRKATMRSDEQAVSTRKRCQSVLLHSVFFISDIRESTRPQGSIRSLIPQSGLCIGYITKRKDDMDRARAEYDAYVEDRFRQRTASILPEEERQVSLNPNFQFPAWFSMGVRSTSVPETPPAIQDRGGQRCVKKLFHFLSIFTLSSLLPPHCSFLLVTPSYLSII